jgi:uncharacterized protein YbbK (DUF523 family)/uncharacterized protein YbgA (DUF1722 family)
MSLGISSCLLGENVRYDGGNKYSPYIVENLLAHIELVPVCPEVAIGLGVPRPPIQLVDINDSILAVGIDNPELDVTTLLQDFGSKFYAQTGLLSGYIFKSRSPSCGVSDTKISTTDGEALGTGIFANQIIRAAPHLPVIDETQLASKDLRDNFLERAFSLSRWHQVSDETMTLDSLKAFHSSHALVLSMHSNNSCEKLSTFLSTMRDPIPGKAAEFYLLEFMECLKHPVTHGDFVTLLTSLRQQLSGLVDRDEAAEMEAAIRSFSDASAPLTLPLARIKELAVRYQLDNMSQQTFLNPSPAEIALRFS